VADGEEPRSLTYAGAGVDIDAGDRAVDLIKDKLRSTYRPEVIGDIGGFGGLFRFPQERFHEPVLVSATDGVGTKAYVAQATGRFDTIGIDLVAMCVDDLVCQGAEPLFFLDYIAVGHLDPEHMASLVEGMVVGCRQAGCALIGGEMAAHPGSMEPGAFDIVGFAVGVVERDRILTGAHVEVGDRLIGLPSPGLRSNGYSLARQVLLDGPDALDRPAWPGAHHRLADELLVPSVIYAPAITALLDQVDVRGVAHITGGGIPGNLGRILPADKAAVVHRASWEEPRIFEEIRTRGGIDEGEMARVFNLGIGMIAAVPPGQSYKALDVLREQGVRAVDIGEVVTGDGTVRIED
jgi:phosphoribosylformylglycinamidine cyclo-ligase